MENPHGAINMTFFGEVWGRGNELSKQSSVKRRCSSSGVDSASASLHQDPGSDLSLAITVHRRGLSSPVTRLQGRAHHTDTPRSTLTVTGAKQGHAFPLSVSCYGWHAEVSHQNLRI